MNRSISLIVISLFLSTCFLLAQTKTPSQTGSPESSWLVKIPEIPLKHADAMKALTNTRSISKTLEKEMENSLTSEMGDPASAMAAAMAMMGGGGAIGQQDVQGFQDLLMAVQEFSEMSNVTIAATFSERLGKVRAEFDESIEALDARMAKIYSGINDGEGATDADVKKRTAAKAQENMERTKIFETYLLKSKPIAQDYRNRLQSLFSKCAPLIAKHKDAKSMAIKQQLMTLKGGIYSKTGEFAGFTIDILEPAEDLLRE
jgi:hypothetical protein